MKQNTRRIWGRVLACCTAALIFVILLVLFDGLVRVVLFSDVKVDNYGEQEIYPVLAKMFTRDGIWWLVFMVAGISYTAGYVTNNFISSGRVQEGKEGE